MRFHLYWNATRARGGGAPRVFAALQCANSAVVIDLVSRVHAARGALPPGSVHEGAHLCFQPVPDSVPYKLAIQNRKTLFSSTESRESLAQQVCACVCVCVCVHACERAKPCVCACSTMCVLCVERRSVQVMIASWEQSLEGNLQTGADFGVCARNLKPRVCHVFPEAEGFVTCVRFQVSSFQAKLSRLEQEKEHWMLESQLLQMKYEKEQQVGWSEGAGGSGVQWVKGAGSSAGRSTCLEGFRSRSQGKNKGFPVQRCVYSTLDSEKRLNPVFASDAQEVGQLPIRPDLDFCVRRKRASWTRRCGVWTRASRGQSRTTWRRRRRRATRSTGA